MSLMQTVMQTVARIAPDKAADPLRHAGAAIGATQEVDAGVGESGRRPSSSHNQKSSLILRTRAIISLNATM